MSSRLKPFIVVGIAAIALLGLSYGVADCYRDSVDMDKTWKVRWIARNGVGITVGLMCVVVHVAYRMLRKGAGR